MIYTNAKLIYSKIRRQAMTNIYYVEYDTTNPGSFVLDVPQGRVWLLLITQTPALFWVKGEMREYPAHSAVLYPPLQKVYYRGCTDKYIDD